MQLDRSVNDSELLEIAVIGKPHGLRGEVTVRAISNRDERFVPGASWVLRGQPVAVRSARRQRAGYVVALEGVNDRNSAEALRGTVAFGHRLDVEDEGNFVHVLIGRRVIAGERDLGRVASVEANPAHDLLVLDSGVLIPMVFVEAEAQPVAQSDAPLIANLPDGLLDLFETESNE